MVPVSDAVISTNVDGIDAVAVGAAVYAPLVVTLVFVTFPSVIVAVAAAVPELKVIVGAERYPFPWFRVVSEVTAMLGEVPVVLTPNVAL